MISGVGGLLYGGIQRLEMRNTMWIYAVVFLLVSETWSMDTGYNQSIPVNSSTTKPRKIHVVVNSTFNLGSDAELMCGNKTWNDTMYVIWEISLDHEACKIAFNTDGRSENNCSRGKTLKNNSLSQSYLHIPDFSLDDLGVYKCESVYSGGIDSYLFRVSFTGSTTSDRKIDNPQSGFPWLYIPVGVVTFVLLVGFFIFALKKLVMLRRCCQADNSRSKTSRTEDVEEVEPYASYVQRVNSIYNSSADFFSPRNAHTHT